METNYKSRPVQITILISNIPSIRMFCFSCLICEFRCCSLCKTVLIGMFVGILLAGAGLATSLILYLQQLSNKSIYASDVTKEINKRVFSIFVLNYTDVYCNPFYTTPLVQYLQIGIRTVFLKLSIDILNPKICDAFLFDYFYPANNTSQSGCTINLTSSSCEPSVKWLYNLMRNYYG
jgi:hypothetical protein